MQLLAMAPWIASLIGGLDCAEVAHYRQCSAKFASRYDIAIEFSNESKDLWCAELFNGL